MLRKSKYFSVDGHAAQDVPTEQIDRRLQEKNDGGVLWLDIAEPTEKDSEMLAGEFGFHPLAIEDLKQSDQRPKVVECSDYIFVVAHERRPAPGRENMEKQCTERGKVIRRCSGRGHTFCSIWCWTQLWTIIIRHSMPMRTILTRWSR